MWKYFAENSIEDVKIFCMELAATHSISLFNKLHASEPHAVELHAATVTHGKLWSHITPTDSMLGLFIVLPLSNYNFH